MAPALRLGWLVAPKALAPKLTVIKEAYDLETSAFIQRAVAAFLDAGHLPEHLAELQTAYGVRRDVMLEALADYFPEEARWTRPAGGMFIWVELAEGVDTTELLWRAVEEEQVAFIPGSAFFAGPASTTAENCLRLNFSNCTPEEIKEGIARLGKVLRST
jgi:2-aminoadipate transaminase